MNVLITGGGTGGHFVPAMAIADRLQKEDPDIRVVYVGAERGIESRLMPERKPAHPYHLVPAEPLYRRQWWKNLKWIVNGPRAWWACGRILARERPDVVVATGGYAAAVVGYRAARRGIPLFLQEQNAFPGLTTRKLAPLAREIVLGFPEAANRLAPGRDTVVTFTGNPVPEMTARRESARAALGIGDDAGVVLVMGGSQGAVAINGALAETLTAGSMANHIVLWATGFNNYEQYRHLNDAPRVQVRPYWDPIGEAYAAADLVVGRAGAMSTAEYALYGLPSVLVPLPSAAADHQAANARAFETAGASVYLDQKDLSGQALGQILNQLLADPDRLASMGRAAAERARPGALAEILGRIRAISK